MWQPRRRVARIGGGTIQRLIDPGLTRAGPRSGLPSRPGGTATRGVGPGGGIRRGTLGGGPGRPGPPASPMISSWVSRPPLTTLSRIVSPGTRSTIAGTNRSSFRITFTWRGAPETPGVIGGVAGTVLTSHAASATGSASATAEASADRSAGAHDGIPGRRTGCSTSASLPCRRPGRSAGSGRKSSRTVARQSGARSRNRVASAPAGGISATLARATGRGLPGRNGSGPALAEIRSVDCPGLRGSDQDEAEENGTEQGEDAPRTAHGAPPRGGRRAGGGRAPRERVCRTALIAGLSAAADGPPARRPRPAAHRDPYIPSGV